MKDLAIAIPCFNSATTLSATLESLLRSDRLIGASIILLDGGSTDFTKAIFDYFSSQSKGFYFIFREFRGIHPAERLNILIREMQYEFIFLCHSDDIYIPEAIFDMISYIIDSDMWAVGSQCGIIQDPIDAAAKRCLPYVDSHLSHPQDPDSIYCEMALWWTISWNSVLLRPKYIFGSQILLDSTLFKFCNDYRFCWEIARAGRFANLPFFSVITRHHQGSDGVLNNDNLQSEASLIRSSIQDEIGLSLFLGPHLIRVMNSITYAYGVWHISKRLYPVSHYRMLTHRLQEFSTTSKRLSHFCVIGERLLSLLS